VSNIVIKDLLEADHAFQEKFGMNFIRPEAKIMFLLKQNGPLSIKEAMSFLDLSYRGFYILMRRMIEKGHVYIKADDSDGRVKRLVLADDGGGCS
jgi:DNA-binding MarR family transcriptional regulator